MQLVGTTVPIFCLDNIGRRPLLLFGSFMLFSCLIINAIVIGEFPGMLTRPVGKMVWKLMLVVPISQIQRQLGGTPARSESRDRILLHVHVLL